jgi:hypothetical protein
MSIKLHIQSCELAEHHEKHYSGLLRGGGDKPLAFSTRQREALALVADEVRAILDTHGIHNGQWQKGTLRAVNIQAILKVKLPPAAQVNLEAAYRHPDLPGAVWLPDPREGALRLIYRRRFEPNRRREGEAFADALQSFLARHNTRVTEFVEL